MTRRSSADRLAGLVLAGGFSTRFGPDDKAVADLAGKPLIRHVVDRLSAPADGVLVNCRREQVPVLVRALGSADASVGLAPDPIPDRGPAAGVAVGLGPCRAAYAAVVACDTPLVDSALLAFLAEEARGSDGAIPRVDGRLRPTLAVYRTDAMREACESTIASGDGSLRSAVDEIDPVIVPEDTVERRTDPIALLDVNTKSDLERANEALDR